MSTGCVKVFDVRQKNTPVANITPAPGETSRETWTVAFGNSYNDAERMIAAGYENGDVKMFDLRNMSLAWECNVKNGVCSLEFDRKDIPMNKLLVSTLEATFQVFDMRTKHPKEGYASVVEKVGCVLHFCLVECCIQVESANTIPSIIPSIALNKQLSGRVSTLPTIGISLSHLPVMDP